VEAERALRNIHDYSDKSITNLKHDERITSVSYSLDGKKIITSSWDRTVKIWDAETGEITATFEHTDWVTSAILSFDEKKLLTSTTNNTSHIWDVMMKKEIITLIGKKAMFSLDCKKNFNYF
jgi:WD40 repeat protein